MTDKEQITEVTKIINRRCEAELGQVHANSKDGKATKTVDTSLIAKDIVNAGYQKIVWHKPSKDGFPPLCKEVLVAVKRTMPSRDYTFITIGKREFYMEDVELWNIGKAWQGDKVLAWTELPTYNEYGVEID